MATRRIKVCNSEQGTIYHVVSRTVNKEFLWQGNAQEVFRKQMYKVAEFCGVEILAYCIMNNHFHIMVRVVSGRSEKLQNEELLERCMALYTNRQDIGVLDQLRAGLLSEDTFKAEATRKLLLARMDDISAYMKILKQRYSIWYNRNYRRWGTHWGERFRSVIVQPSQTAMMAVAAYIVLNPVRAGICRDPKDYLFSSYAEAMAGRKTPLNGLIFLTGKLNKYLALSEFRRYLEWCGIRPQKSEKADGGAVEKRETVRLGKEKFSISEMRKERWRFFTLGVAIGTRAFLDGIMTACAIRSTRRTRPRVCLPGNETNLESLR